MEHHEIFEKGEEYVKKRLQNNIVREFVQDGAKIILHLIPVNSFNITYPQKIDNINTDNLQPICGLNKILPFNNSIMAVGQLFNSRPACYTELNSKYIIEAVDMHLLKNKTLHFSLFKEKISDSVKKYLDILINDLKVDIPIYFSLVFKGAKEYEILDKPGNRPKIQRDRYQNLIETPTEIDSFLERTFEAIIRNSF
ncbi:MAG: hypothetical protein FJ150_09895 [Euryarchaeota archaeon]|nr:hypothetical protein [Euryarchaeota archaeon]